MQADSGKSRTTARDLEDRLESDLQAENSLFELQRDEYFDFWLN
jgi:hypothetical protein